MNDVAAANLYRFMGQSTRLETAVALARLTSKSDLTWLKSALLPKDADDVRLGKLPDQYVRVPTKSGGSTVDLRYWLPLISGATAPVFQVGGYRYPERRGAVCRRFPKTHSIAGHHKNSPLASTHLQECPL